MIQQSHYWTSVIYLYVYEKKIYVYKQIYKPKRYENTKPKR